MCILQVVCVADHTNLEGPHDDSRHADDWLSAWRCATEFLQEYHLKCGRRGGRYWFPVGRVGPSGTRPVGTVRYSQMSVCTSSPINEYSWRKEVESRPLILDFGLCQIITDAYQQIADQFLKWLLSLNSSYIGVSWSSCHFANG